MKIELTYKLKEGVRAKDVDLSRSAGMLCRRKESNPDDATVIQLYNNWFNVKVVLVESDGTKVVKDYASPDFLDYFSTKHNRKGPPKAQGSSFIFQYSRKFGEMSIKLLDTTPDERPVIIVRGHKIKGNMSVPRAFYLTPHESTKLPYAGDRVDDFFEDEPGNYGTTVHCLDLNEEAIPGQIQMLEEENLKGFETKLAGVMSYKKFAYDLRGPTYADDFYSHGACREAGALNKRDCETTISEIANNKHFPERVNASVTTALISRFVYFLQETVDGLALDDKKKKALITALNHKLHRYEQLPPPIVAINAESSPDDAEVVPETVSLVAEEPYLAPSPEPVEITNIPLIEIIEDQSLSDTIARLASSSAAEFSSSSEEEFNPDDLLLGPSKPKRLRVMAE